jgi:hypothetical protein
MGPNTLSGHLSVIYTTECQFNFALRIIHPIITGKTNIVEVTPEAEARDISNVQEKAKRLVWATGCSSWFIDETTGRNTIMFPDWQFKFWWRSVFVNWKDLEYRSVDTKGYKVPTSGWKTWLGIAGS